MHLESTSIKIYHITFNLKSRINNFEILKKYNKNNPKWNGLKLIYSNIRTASI